MKFNMKRGLVFLLILTLMSSVMPFAFATTTAKWVEKAPMSSPRRYFQTEVINGKVYAIGGMGAGDIAKYSVEEYNSKTDTWTQKAPMSVARTMFQTAVVDGKIYAMGADFSTDLEVYDPEKNSWTKKAPMSIKRILFKALVINKNIYVIGGLSGGTPISSVEVYNTSTNTWTQKASMPQSITSYGAEVINGKIYVMGGDTRTNGYTNLVYLYDPAKDTWTQKASMSSSKCSFETEVIGNKIYTIGGAINLQSSSSVEEYDILTNQWTQKASMSSKRIFFKTQLLNGEIYAIGGESNNSTVEAYNPITDTWVAKPSLFNNNQYFESVLLNDDIYVIGGYNDKKSLSSVEAYSEKQLVPTLTVTASPNKVKVGNRFTTTVAIHNVSNIYAEDIKIDYDAERFEYLGASAKDGLKIYKEDKSKPGSVRFIVAHLGKDSGATGDKDLIELTFKAKSVGIGKVDITKGRIADNDVLEMDVAEENCGEDTIEVEANKDVNRTGEYTLLDLGIDAYYYGMQADQTDTTRFDTDVIPDGIIDDKDLTAITQSILDNGNYPFN